jgi:hypothetical protein
MLAPRGKFPGVPPRAQVTTQIRDNACFTKGKICNIAERPVNKGLPMLQMLVAKSGHEKDHHAAFALPFLRQAQLAFPPRPLTLMQYRLSVAVVARAGLCAFQARMKPLAALSEHVS